MIDMIVIREWGIIIAGIVVLLFFAKNLFFPLIFIITDLIRMYKKEHKNGKKKRVR